MIIVLCAWASVWVYLGRRRVGEMDDRNLPWVRHHYAKVVSDKTQTYGCLLLDLHSILAGLG